MNGTVGDVCRETDKLTNHSNDLLNKIWKTMKQTKRKEDEERLEQLINQMREDVESYEQFKEAITEFLCGPQAQARRRCAYQCVYDRTNNESMTAHFLRYSALANNLTPKLTASDIVEIISGH